jgi:hypothetical protein
MFTLTKSAKKTTASNARRLAAVDTVEVRLKGPGATTVGLVDNMGNVLMTRRVAVSGSAEVEAHFQMPLILSTPKGEIAAVPMLFHQTSAEQVVTVGGKDPAAAAAKRQRALKLDATAVKKIKAATEAAAAQIGETGRLVIPAHR